MYRMPRGLDLLLGGLLLSAVAVAAVIGSCGSSEPSEEDVRAGLSNLPYRLRFFDTEPPPAADWVVAGSATREDGIRVEFAFVDGTLAHERLEALIPHYRPRVVSYAFELGLGFSFASSEPSKWDGRAVAATKVRMAVAIEDAVCRRLSGEPCPL
jgi:hypothetical protein